VVSRLDRPLSRRAFLRQSAGLTLLAGGAAVSAPVWASLAGCVLPPTALWPYFDGGTAFDHLTAQVGFGPRVPGLAGHDACKAYLIGQLKRQVDEVQEQTFTFAADDKTLNLSNILGFLSPEQAERVLLCAHWDTRPTADRDPEPLNRIRPIPGANDGASGPAVLLEVARQLRLAPLQIGVDFAFFDGEDYGPLSNRMYLGSRYFANHQPQPRPRYAVLLDMVGDRDQVFWWEGNSQARAPEVVAKIWQAAADLGYGSVFKPAVKYSITDDHLPLLDQGLPTADVIDFDYPYWHTLADTPDKCSAESLARVGQVILRALYLERSSTPSPEPHGTPASVLEAVN
jgi:glutaminyl-peptide cyclotransferase